MAFDKITPDSNQNPNPDTKPPVDSEPPKELSEIEKQALSEKELADKLQAESNALFAKSGTNGKSANPPKKNPSPAPAPAPAPAPDSEPDPEETGDTGNSAEKKKGPTLSPDKTRAQVVLSKQVDAALVRYSKMSGISKSGLIAKAIVDFLKANDIPV